MDCPTRIYDGSNGVYRICSGESRIEVLKGLDLDIEKGEFCVLLGPSGSGKSTLLNIIGGIDGADEGAFH